MAQERVINHLIEYGLNFILTHVPKPEEEPVWPRTISTKTTEGKQILVSSKQDALAWFKAANFQDCRVSAYPSREEWAVRLLGQAPNLLFIDEDESRFNSRESLERAHIRTLKAFKEKLDGAHPTVLWSGNGYHTLQPIEAFVLESVSAFASFDNPSRKLCNGLKSIYQITGPTRHIVLVCHLKTACSGFLDPIIQKVS